MAVLLRSLLGGEREFFGAALAELTGVKPVRAAWPEKITQRLGPGRSAGRGAHFLRRP